MFRITVVSFSFGFLGPPNNKHQKTEYVFAMYKEKYLLIIMEIFQCVLTTG